MTKLSIVAIVDAANGLGKDNQLLCYLPADLAHFKTITRGKPIVMGRKTYESIGKPLPDRRNVVISRHQASMPGVDVFPSIEKALSALVHDPEVMIIGGAQMYQQTLPSADYVYLTRIAHRFAADVFFPVLDATIWECKKYTQRAADEKNPYALSFLEFERKTC